MDLFLISWLYVIGLGMTACVMREVFLRYDDWLPGHVGGSVFLVLVWPAFGAVVFAMVGWALFMKRFTKPRNAP